MVCCVSLLFLQSVFGADKEARFFVRGTLELELPPKQAASAKARGLPTAYKFGISVEGCRWFVTTYNAKPVDGYYEANQSSCDGVNVYFFPYRKLKKDELFTGRSSGEDRQEKNVAATVGEELTPLLDTSYGQYAWLTWASTCYFDTVKTNRLKPFWDAGNPMIGFTDCTVPASWTQSQKTPYLPSMISFNSHEKYYRMGKNGRNTVEYLEWKEGMTGYHPFETAVFKVHATTNTASGLELPTKSSIEIYNYKKNLWGTWHLTAESIVDQSEKSTFKPDVTVQTTILDLRFNNSDVPPPAGVVIYPATNWIDKTNSYVQHWYRNSLRTKLKVIDPETKTKSRASTVRYAVIFFSVTGLVLLIFINRKFA